MAETVASGLSLQSGATERQTRAYEMAGGNAVEVVVEMVGYTDSSVAVSIYLDESNDQQNWAAVGGSTIMTLSASVSIGPSATSVTGISSRFVRLRAVLTAGPTAVMSATMNVANL